MEDRSPTSEQIAGGDAVIAPTRDGERPPPITSALSPAMRQYLEQKERVGDAILLFRMGDFYETFYDDAKTVARVLGLTLTSRNKSSNEPIPLAGVPYHAVDGYIAKLVRAGFKVAISEQLEDPRQAKGVVKRGVERIITPGTLTDEALLDERADNYLAALCPSGRTWTDGKIGLACVELASGRFFAEMLTAAQVEDELARLRPAELLIPEKDIDAKEPFVERLGQTLAAAVSYRPAHVFDAHLASTRICEHFAVAGVAGFGFDRFDASLCAAAAILDYLKETQKSALSHLLRIMPRHPEDRVIVDQAALRSLEIERTMRDGSRQGSLLGAIDMTAGPMGTRRLRDWLCSPLRHAADIRARQAAIANLRDQPEGLRKIRESIGEMGDMERIAARLGVGRASPRDLVGLGRALRRCGQLASAIGPPATTQPEAGPDLLTKLAALLGGLEELASFLETALKPDAPPVIRDGGFILDGYDAELDRLRNIGRQGHQWLAEFQVREAQRTGIPSLKVGYNSVFGYYIEITHQHRDKAPADYVRKQTIRNAERYTTEELKRHENEVLGAADRARLLEAELFEEIRRRAAADLPKLLAEANAAATLDVLAGLAELSRRRDYCRPELVEDGEADSGGTCGFLEIMEGRHPVLDVSLAERFVPNDCRLASEGSRLLIITGPNMAGKSTYIRQVALLVLLAQTGSYVPAKSMRWTPVDHIFARVGAGDELTRGQSTFMVEMVETARILNAATARSLVVLDEIGRGTSTYDGLALAWAITEHVVEHIGCRTLFATHYHELTDLAGHLAGVANFNVAVREELRPRGTGRDVVFLYKIVPGPTDRSYGVHVAAMAGLPRSVVRRGEAILRWLESTTDRKWRGKGLTSKKPQTEQLPLFADPPAMPDWCRRLLDALDAIALNKTTPIEALTLLEQLQAHVRQESTHNHTIREQGDTQ
jgi:DNA mismatch repair protein MutS